MAYLRYRVLTAEMSSRRSLTVSTAQGSKVACEVPEDRQSRPAPTEAKARVDL